MPSNLGVWCDQTLQNWKQFSCKMNKAVATVSKDLGSMPLLHRFSEKYSSMKNHGVYTVYIKKLHFWYQRVKNGSCKDGERDKPRKGRVQDMDCLWNPKEFSSCGHWWLLVVMVVIGCGHRCCKESPQRRRMGVFLWAKNHIFYLIHIYVLHTGKTHAHTDTLTRPGCHFVECCFSFKITFNNFPGLNNQQQHAASNMSLKTVLKPSRKFHTASSGYTRFPPPQSSRRWKKFSCTKRPSSRTCWFLFGHPSSMSAKNGR